jgi:hypothetical protein
MRSRLSRWVSDSHRLVSLFAICLAKSLLRTHTRGANQRDTQALCRHLGCWKVAVHNFGCVVFVVKVARGRFWWPIARLWWLKYKSTIIGSTVRSSPTILRVGCRATE